MQFEAEWHAVPLGRSCCLTGIYRVIGSYGGEQEPDEYDEKIKEKEEEMVALIAENARVGSYTDEFDERYRRIAEEITTLKEEQIEARRKKKLADSYEQWLKDMDSFLEKQTCQIPKFINGTIKMYKKYKIKMYN